jgi:hypothetical protein
LLGAVKIAGIKLLFKKSESINKINAEINAKVKVTGAL